MPTYHTQYFQPTICKSIKIMLGGQGSLKFHINLQSITHFILNIQECDFLYTSPSCPTLYVTMSSTEAYLARDFFSMVDIAQRTLVAYTDKAFRGRGGCNSIWPRS